MVGSGLSQTVLAGRYFARNWMLGYNEEESIGPIEEIESAFSSIDKATLQSRAEEHFDAVEEIFHS